MRILFLSKWPDATSHFRCLIPSKYLAKYGEEVRHNYTTPIDGKPGSGINKEDVEWADVIVFQRPITIEEAQAAEQIKIKRPSKLIIGEYDDDYSSVPDWNPGYTFLKAKEKEWPEIVKFYDGITVSTDPLKEVFASMTSVPISVIPNALDVDDFEPFNEIENSEIILPYLADDLLIRPNKTLPIKQFNEFAKDKIVVGWFGSRTHFCDIDLLPEELNLVAEKYSDVIFLFVGYMQFRFVCMDKLFDRVFLANGLTPIKRYYDFLRTVKIDISLCPVLPNKFNRSKSCLKNLESMACRKVPVCSEFDTYETGFNKGFLAGYRFGDWADKIFQAVELIKSGEHIEKIIEPNYKYVFEHFNAKDRSCLYVEFFKSLLEKKRG